jgi:8-oxo-dGTP pyrophosphatase MutT (NUDIX family)
VLLIRMDVTRGPLWITPGGRIEPGESHEVALRRELEEEVGRSDFDVGPLVWIREGEFEWDGRIIPEREHFYMIRTESFVPDFTGNPVEDEARRMTEHRWWLVQDLLRSAERFAPARIGSLLEDLIENGPPRAPVETGT